MIPPSATPSFAAALRYWLRLGFLSFGGPAGQIAIMQHDLVDRRRWIDQHSFLQALNFCMVLPGPEAQQLATYIGWRLHGIRGGVAAGVLFVLPGALVLYALSWVAAAHGDVPLVRAVFAGLKPVVVAIVLQALWRIGRRALTTPMAGAIAAAAFVAIQFLQVPFPVIVLAAGAMGWWRAPGASVGSAARPPSLGRGLKLAGLYLVLLAVPVAGVLALLGPAPFLDLARFFTQAAFVTFGGAYAVLPYVAKAAVETFGWLTAEEMINGLALAETTPGPLILVLQYVGFFAGWNHDSSSLIAATAGAALTTYVTFLPSIFFILIGAPYVEWITGQRRLSAALGAITAGVVGVIGSLAWFFGAHVFFPPGGADVPAMLAAAATLALALRYDPPLPAIVAAGAAFGVFRLAAGF
jgi:chromate transporter